MIKLSTRNLLDLRSAFRSPVSYREAKASLMDKGYSSIDAYRMIKEAMRMGKVAEDKGVFDFEAGNPERSSLGLKDYVDDDKLYYESFQDNPAAYNEALTARRARRAELRRRMAEKADYGINTMFDDERELQSKNPTYPRFKEDAVDSIPNFAEDLATGKRKSNVRRTSRFGLRRTASDEGCPSCRKTAAEAAKCVDVLKMYGFSSSVCKDACGKIITSLDK
ncbi:MAG: hypothetical protein WC783_00960 [Candidatus Paceibacterota bacterium]|jgi:hypothetical protein